MQRQENTQRRRRKIAASDSVNLKSNMKHINIHALRFSQKATMPAVLQKCSELLDCHQPLCGGGGNETF